MRVLLTSLPIRSHLMPVLVPLAEAMRARGHEALIATGPAMAQLDHVAVLPDLPSPADFGERPRWYPERDGVLDVPLFAEELTVRAAANVLDLARRWQPDVIVRETNEYGGRIAAEVLGIPHALIEIAPHVRIPDLAGRMDAVRARFGVSGTEPVFTAGLLPRFWHPVQHAYRVPTDQTTRDDAVSVVATFGTNADLLMSGSKLPRVVAEALGLLEVKAVLAIGDAEWTGPRPSNVRLEPEVPQQQLLNSAEVFVTHAGYSSVRESLTAGVPMVCLPLFADQPNNAARVEELKAGVSVDVKTLTADVLAERIQHVLRTRAYHDKAENLAAEIADLPVVGKIPDDLVSAV